MRGDRLESERLVLRSWREEDREPFAAMNADPRVMEFFPSVQTREQSDLLVNRAAEVFREHGFQFWACEEKASGRFIGFIGLSRPMFEAAFQPCVEIGWRLAHHAWGKGYATEGAKRALRYGFEELGLPEIVSFTATTNLRSIHVMEKIGMKRDVGGTFAHPRVPVGHALSVHVLYRIGNPKRR